MAVYFITAPSGYVKIGFTDQPIEHRLASIQTGCWEPLTIALVISGNPKHERHYHRRFRVDRVRGDWFRLSSAIQETIDLFNSSDSFKEWQAKVIKLRA